MAKPWEKYQDAKPWEKYQEPVETKPDMGQGKAALIGLEQGATLGLRPVVAGIGAGLGSAVGAYKNGGQLSDILTAGKQGFKEGRQEAIEEQKIAQEQYPKTAMAANVGSSLLTLPFLPAVSTAKGAAALGAGLGAAQAAGNAESPKEAALNIASGAALGGAGLAASKTIGNKAAQSLENLAETKAFKAAGAMLKDFRAAYSRNPERVNELGRTMLDNGLVKAGDTVESIAQKSEALKRQTGQQIGKVYEKVLDKLTDPEVSAHLSPEAILEIQSSGFHPEQQASELKSMVYNKLKGQLGSTAAINKANQVIDELALNGNHITPQAALELKGQVDSMINWSKKSQDLPMDQEALKMVRRYIQDKLNKQVSVLDKALGSNETQELLRLNKLFGNVATISNVSRDRVLRDSANRSFGLTDTIMGGAGLGVGHGVGSSLGHGNVGALVGMGALGLGNKVGRTYGNAAIASGANALSEGLQNNATPFIAPATTLIRSPSKLRKE